MIIDTTTLNCIYLKVAWPALCMEKLHVQSQAEA